MILKRLFITCIVVAFSISGCASSLYDTEILHNKAANLKNMTQKARGAILREIDDNMIFQYLQERYPNDLKEFEDYYLEFKNVNGYAVMLMCNKEQTKVLLEDISCTGGVDGGELFKQDISCEFTLNVEVECSK